MYYDHIQDKYVVELHDLPSEKLRELEESFAASEHPMDLIECMWIDSAITLQENLRSVGADKKLPDSYDNEDTRGLLFALFAERYGRYVGLRDLVHKIFPNSGLINFLDSRSPENYRTFAGLTTDKFEFMSVVLTELYDGKKIFGRS